MTPEQYEITIANALYRIDCREQSARDLASMAHQLARFRTAEVRAVEAESFAVAGRILRAALDESRKAWS